MGSKFQHTFVYANIIKNRLNTRLRNLNFHNQDLLNLCIDRVSLGKFGVNDIKKSRRITITVKYYAQIG